MFLSSSEGVVFLGARGPCYHANSKQASARSLVEMVVAEYREQHDGECPRELFLHAKSSFTDQELTGFVAGAPSTNVVGVQIADAKDNIKLFRQGDTP